MRLVLLATATFVVGFALGLVAPSLIGASPPEIAEASCGGTVDGRTRIELVLAEPSGAGEAIVDSEFLLDGAPLLPLNGPSAQCGQRSVVRAVAPGTHMLSGRVRYRRDVKVLTQSLGATRLSMTLLPGGEFDLRRTLPVTVPEGETLRVAGAVQLVPGSPADRLSLAPLQNLHARRD